MVLKREISRQLDDRVEDYINVRSRGSSSFIIKIGEIAKELGEPYHKVKISIYKLEEKGIIRTRQGGRRGLNVILLELSEKERKKAEEEARERKRMLRKKAYNETLTKGMGPQLMINENLQRHLNKIGGYYLNHKQVFADRVYYIVCEMEKTMVYKKGHWNGELKLIGLNRDPIGSVTFKCRNGVCGLNNISINEEERYKGFGSEMLQYLENIMKNEGVKKILGVISHEDNNNYELIYTFFQKNGFKPKRDDDQIQWGLVTKDI